MCYLIIVESDYFITLILPCLAAGLVKCQVKLLIVLRPETERQKINKNSIKYRRDENKTGDW